MLLMMATSMVMAIVHAARSMAMAGQSEALWRHWESALMQLCARARLAARSHSAGGALAKDASARWRDAVASVAACLKWR